MHFNIITLLKYIIIELPESAACSDSVELTPNNPFLEAHKETPLELSMQTLQVICIPYTVK